MGRRYAAIGFRSVAPAPENTCLGITGGTTIRTRVYDVIFGSDATPADNALRWDMERSTAAGTGTTVTPNPIDPADPVSITSALRNHSTDPTYGGLLLLAIAANQRSTQRWVAAPGGELVVPATAAAGMGLTPVHTSFTGQVYVTIHFEE